MICAKGGGLASSNEMFTVGCSIVEVAFEFLISTDANELTSAPNRENITFQYFMENVGCLSDHAMMSASGTLEQVVLFWFE